MAEFFADLYSIAYEFYRIRDAGSERQLPRILCIVTGMCVFMNLVNVFELLTGIRIPLPLGNRMSVIASGVVCFGLGVLCVNWFLKTHPELQSPEKMRDRSIGLSRTRKVALLAAVVGNFILLFILSSLVRGK